MGGVLTVRREWKTWWPTCAIFAAVLVFHVLTIVSARFRIPVEPLTFPCAAAAVASAGAGLRRLALRVMKRANAGLCRVNTALRASRT
jgi:hypothetical protein